MKITYHAAVSADGFIAGEDGDVTWLDGVEIEGADAFLEGLFAGVDALAMGRGTYDFVLGHGSWPYLDKPAWVFTRRDLQRLDGAALRPVKSISEFVEDSTARATAHLWLIGGGQLASAFLDHGLTLEIDLFELPVTLGAGIPVLAGRSFSNVLEGDTRITQMQGCRRIETSLSR